MSLLEQQRERARLATGEELKALLFHPSADVLLSLLENPALDETLLGILLSRKDLPAEVIETVAGTKSFLKSYAVKKALVFHPRAPRLVGLRLLRDLYLMDLVQYSLSPAVSTELKRHAEEYVIARLPQLPLRQLQHLFRRRHSAALVQRPGAASAAESFDAPKNRSRRLPRNGLVRDRLHQRLIRRLPMVNLRLKRNQFLNQLR